MTSQRVDFPVPDGAAVTACRSCDAPIVWIVTAAGKRMPISAATIEQIDGELRGESHFADCPQSRSWSQRSGSDVRHR